MFRDAFAAVFDAVRGLDGVPVIYRMGSVEIPLTAVRGTTTFDIVDKDGFGRQVVTRDYMFSVADLKVGNTLIEPEPGHVIQETIAGKTESYEIIPSKGRKPWQFSDPDHTEYRVHTQSIGQS